MQRRGDFPIEKLCTFYSYKDIGQAIAAMHDGSVRIDSHMAMVIDVFGSNQSQVIKPVIEW